MTLTWTTEDGRPAYARPSDKQLHYVRGMQKQLRLSDRLLDAHCVATFGHAFDLLSGRQCSALIDEMKRWKSIPDKLLREAGQMDLFGGAS